MRQGEDKICYCGFLRIFCGFCPSENTQFCIFLQIFADFSQTFLGHLCILADFFFVAPEKYDEKAAKNWKEDTSGLMQQVISVIENVKVLEAKEIESTIKNWIQENELGMGKIMQPLRIAMVGEMKGPDLFEIIAVLGKDETIQRLHNAINNFKNI